MSSGGQPVDCHRRPRTGDRDGRRSRTTLEDYVRRAEDELLDGRFAAAFAIYSRGIVARIVPTQPDAAATIDASYAERLARGGDSVAALTGASFARWVFSDYMGAIELLDALLAMVPDHVYSTLFRGSSRVLLGAEVAAGLADLDRASELDPENPDVRYVIADAYTYGGRPDPKRAYTEATWALAGGLDTPRVHAILASAELSFGNDAAAGEHFARHLELVTTELRRTESLEPGGEMLLELSQGRVYEIPLPAAAGATIAIATTSSTVTDSIAVLLDPDGVPLTGGDDEHGSFAAVVFGPVVTDTYRLRVASFEAVETGPLLVSRA